MPAIAEEEKTLSFVEVLDLFVTPIDQGADLVNISLRQRITALDVRGQWPLHVDGTVCGGGLLRCRSRV